MDMLFNQFWRRHLLDNFIASAGDSEDDAVDGMLEQALGEDEPVDSEA
jgi:hypothetical protein